MTKQELREKQKQEGLARLKMLNVSGSVTRGFTSGTIFYSERQNRMFDGILYWLSNEDRYVEEVSKFEKEHNALVYHAQLSHTEFGDLLALLFVGKDERDWEDDKNDLKQGQAFSYVINLEDTSLSEFGSIGVEPKNGGVSRTW